MRRVINNIEIGPEVGECTMKKAYSIVPAYSESGWRLPKIEELVLYTYLNNLGVGGFNYLDGNGYWLADDYCSSINNGKPDFYKLAKGGMVIRNVRLIRNI